MAEPPIDPVCGMTVRADPPPWRAEHGGKEFRFCAKACRDKFLANPAAYADAPPRVVRVKVSMDDPFDVGGLTEEPPPPPVVQVKPLTGRTGRRWTCPMDPEIVRDEPGACPKCGMDLEPVLTLESASQGDAEVEGRWSAGRLAAGSAVLAAVAMALAMLDMTPAHDWIRQSISNFAFDAILFVLTTPVVLIAGFPLYIRGFAGVFRGRVNMFTLIGLGVLAAYAYSAFAWLAPGRFPEAARSHGRVMTYFDSAAMIVALVWVGQALEVKARRRAGDSLRQLLQLRPEKARRIAGSFDEEIPIDKVRPGDRLRVRPGDAVPVDGVVLQGNSAVDESSFTGEPIPVDKAPNDRLLGGSVNTTGALVMEAKAVGEATVLARIARAVESAQKSRPPIAALADRVAQWFVPAVVLVAILTAGIWYAFGPEPRSSLALVNAASVLIVACPCALGLATPMAIVVAAGRAARRGIVVRDASALERGAAVTLVLLDKTGTLTEGRPAFRDVKLAKGVDESELLSTAAAAEVHSEHPIARAILAEAAKRRLTSPPTVGFVATPGAGAEAVLARRRIRVGRREFAETDGARFAGFDEWALEAQAAGSTVLYVAHGDRALGAIAVHDPVRPNVKDVLDGIKALDIKVAIVTGDAERTARAVAERLAIGSVQARLTPVGKQHGVAEAQARGDVVAVVGDGVNDAPALARADVGIAMGGGAGAAIESAPVTLLGGDLRALPDLFQLSRLTLRTIRQNLFWAFAYNVAGIPVAAGLGAAFAAIVGASNPLDFLLPPVFAAIAMTFSSLLVLVNSLRLARAPLTRPGR